MALNEWKRMDQTIRIKDKDEDEGNEIMMMTPFSRTIIYIINGTEHEFFCFASWKKNSGKSAQRQNVSISPFFTQAQQLQKW